MAKKINSEDIQLYTSWRDDFLNIVKEQICKECTDPIKDTKIIDCTDPMKCECRCDRVNKLIAAASKIDEDITELIKTVK